MLNTYQLSLALGLPLILFVCGLHRVRCQMPANSERPLERVWLALYVVVQMFSTLWTANVYSQQFSATGISAASLEAGAIAGPVFFGILMGLLYVRDLGAGARRGLRRLRQKR